MWMPHSTNKHWSKAIWCIKAFLLHIQNCRALLETWWFNYEKQRSFLISPYHCSTVLKYQISMFWDYSVSECLKHNNLLVKTQKASQIVPTKAARTQLILCEILHSWQSENMEIPRLNKQCFGEVCWTTQSSRDREISGTPPEQGTRI